MGAGHRDKPGAGEPGQRRGGGGGAGDQSRGGRRHQGPPRQSQVGGLYLSGTRAGGDHCNQMIVFNYFLIYFLHVYVDVICRFSKCVLCILYISLTIDNFFE